jgi:hypothetical protein
MEQGTAQQPVGAVGAPRLRPLDVGQKLDAAIKLTTRNFKTLAGIILLLVGPVQLISFLITVSTLPDDYVAGGALGGGATPDTDADVSAGFYIGQLIVALLGLLVYALAPAACFKAIGSAYLGEQPTIGESIRYALRRLHSILLVFLLASLAWIAGTIALIVPGIYLWVAFSLAVPALMLEGCRGTKALGRSHGLIKDHWWRSFGFLLVAYLLMGVISFMLGGILGAASFTVVDDDSISGLVLNGVVNLLAQVITTPFIAAATIVLYFDLRIRKEAFDLQLLAHAIGGRAPTDAAATPAMPWVAPPGWVPQQPWGQPAQQGCSQPPQPPPGWGHPQQPPPQAPPGQWGQPPPPPPQAPPGQGWGQPQPPPSQPQQGEAQRWEPPPPPQAPPPPAQQWEPPAPPAPPDPPDRSPSE